MSQAGLIDIEASNPQIPTQFDGDSGSAVPLANVLTVEGETVANATNSKPLFTSGSGNTITAEIQVGAAITGAPADKNDAGLVSFDDTEFIVDSNGFVSLADAVGDVDGPASSTDNAIVRWDGITGKLIQDSSVLLDDNANISQVQNFNFDITPSLPGTSEGTLYWDETDHTLALKNDEVDVTLQIGQEEYIRVRNESGSAISNGQLVYITGTEVGGEERPLVDLALADAAVTSRVIGIATHSIENNSYGYVTNFGLIRDIDTSSFSGGDSLFLSETVAGSITNTEPVSPNISVTVGYAVKIDATNGSALVLISPESQTPAGDATEVTVQARKGSVGTINVGDVVYQSGYNVGAGVILVELADSDDPTKMPALGIARESFTNATNGTVVISGLITGQNTAAYSVGDNLYVSTTAGALTNVRPTAANTLVQKVGNVGRSNVSNGTIFVVGAGRSNDIPNTMPDNYFRIVDDGNNSKVMQFQASGITAATTRTFTAPDNSGTLTLGSGFTPNGIIYASNSTTVASGAALIDGQLFIGSTGVAPAVGSLASADGSITITPGAGTIDLAVAAADDAILTVTGDSGGALSPTAGNVNVLGGPGVTVTGSGSTLTINSVVYTDQGGSTSVVSDSGSFSTAAITLTLPASPAQGERCEFVASTADALVIQAAGTQVINIGSSASTAGGTATTTAKGDAVTLIYQSSSDDWFALNAVGVFVLA